MLDMLASRVSDHKIIELWWDDSSDESLVTILDEEGMIKLQPSDRAEAVEMYNHTYLYQHRFEFVSIAAIAAA